MTQTPNHDEETTMDRYYVKLARAGHTVFDRERGDLALFSFRQPERAQQRADLLNDTARRAAQAAFEAMFPGRKPRIDNRTPAQVEADRTAGVR